jgi:ABC-2 type transport system permease protein
MNSKFTVIKFTFLSRFRSKSFRVMSIIIIILMTVLINLPASIDMLSSHGAAKIDVISGNQKSAITTKLADFYSKQEKLDIAIVPLASTGNKEADDKQAKQKIADKEISGYLELSDDPASGFRLI